MAKVVPVDPADYSFDILRDLSIQPRKHQPGPPARIDGMTVGIVTMTEDAPHNGEMHPNGDEFLYVISGQVRVTWDSAPGDELLLGPGQACIVPKGEWHKVAILEKTQLLHMTPGPDGPHRPLI
jgi:mannose-6-phosphate isomerase-like protein (cupin superfamily)